MPKTDKISEWEEAEYYNQANYFSFLCKNMGAIFDGLEKACSAENGRKTELDNLNLEYTKIQNEITKAAPVNLTGRPSNANRLSPDQLTNTVGQLEILYENLKTFNASKPPQQQNTDRPSIRHRLRFTGNSAARKTDPVSNLIEEGKNELQEFKVGNMHPARSTALGKIRSAVFREGVLTPSAYLKMLLKADHQNENRFKAGVKVFAKRKFGRTTNHPERKILKLLCQYREDSTIEAYKHNSKILREINSLSATHEKSSGDINKFLEAIHTTSDIALSTNEPNSLKGLYDVNFSKEITDIIEDRKNEEYSNFNADGYRPGR